MAEESTETNVENSEIGAVDSSVPISNLQRNPPLSETISIHEDPQADHTEGKDDGNNDNIQNRPIDYVFGYKSPTC